MEQGKFVVVFSPIDEVENALFCSRLDGLEIPYITLNQGLQNLFGVGVIGAGHNPLVGPIVIKVPEEYKGEVDEIVAEFRSQRDINIGSGDIEPYKKLLSKRIMLGFLFSILMPFLLGPLAGLYLAISVLSTINRYNLEGVFLKRALLLIMFDLFLIIIFLKIIFT